MRHKTLTCLLLERQKFLTVAKTDATGAPPKARKACAFLALPLRPERWGFSRILMNFSEAEFSALHAPVSSNDAPMCPLPHQLEAVTGIAASLISSDRAKTLMACGTGKTLVAMLAAKSLSPRTVVVLLPTLGLLKQTHDAWTEQARLGLWNREMRTLCVCSDSSILGAVVSMGEDLDEPSVDFSFPTCTDPGVLATFLDCLRDNGDGDSVSVVFCTYHSAHIFRAAMDLRANGAECIDVGIFDEAHKTVGASGKPFSFALLDTNIPIRKRLFFTATPRVVARNGTAALEGDDFVVASMFDESTYGPTAYELTFSEAARRGIICPYRIVISLVDDDTFTSDDIERTSKSTLAKQFVLRKAMHDFSLHRAITFHSTVSDAQAFSSPSTADGRFMDVRSFHVCGAQSARTRSRILRDFAIGGPSVVSNARCLTEGIDVPSVDVVAFMDRKTSQVDIVQAVGRSLRLSPGKSHGYVLLPLHVNVRLGETLEQALDRTSLRSVVDVLRTLFANDPEFQILFNSTAAGVDGFMSARHGGTRTPRSQRLFSRIESNSVAALSCSAISIDFGCLPPVDHVSAERLFAALKTRLVRETRGVFEEMLHQMLEHKNLFGHCGPSLNGPYRALAAWGRSQRAMARTSSYPAHKRERLEAVGFSFRPAHAAREIRFAELVEFQRKYGHCSVPTTPEYKWLRQWTAGQRNEFKRAHYDPAFRKRLYDLGFRFDAMEALVERRVSELWQLKDATGSVKVPRTAEYTALLQWCVKQRCRARQSAYPAALRARLESLGFEFNPYMSRFESRFFELKRFHEKYGHSEAPREEPYLALHRWSKSARGRATRGKLNPKHRDLLMSLNFRFMGEA